MTSSIIDGHFLKKLKKSDRLARNGIECGFKERTQASERPYFSAR